MNAISIYHRYDFLSSSINLNEQQTDKKSRSHSTVSPIHVSCFITAPNRASPIFQVLPERNAVHIVPDALPSQVSTKEAVEWTFHKLFTSIGSYTEEFFQTITIPALTNTCFNGINTNIIACGIYPTQKSRLLFGKSSGNITINDIKLDSINTHSVSYNLSTILDEFGQVGGLLHYYFTNIGLSTTSWKLGISSWMIVTNAVTDVLISKGPTKSPKNAKHLKHEAPLTFISIEVNNLDHALRLLQVAKTNRIIFNQQSETAHLFVRLAFYNNGQLSTLHIADIVDLRSVQDYTIQDHEKSQWYALLDQMREAISSGSPLKSSQSLSPATVHQSTAFQTTLSYFLHPLFTRNTKTYLYGNIIDSRSCLSESVNLLNGISNVKGYSCACQRLDGIEYSQLEFTIDNEDGKQVETNNSIQGHNILSEMHKFCNLRERTPHSVMDKTVAVDPNVITQTWGTITRQDSTVYPSDTMNWLETFTQRKLDILGGSNDARFEAYSSDLTPTKSAEIQSNITKQNETKEEGKNMQDNTQPFSTSCTESNFEGKRTQNISVSTTEPLKPDLQAGSLFTQCMLSAPSVWEKAVVNSEIPISSPCKNDSLPIADISNPRTWIQKKLLMPNELGIFSKVNIPSCVQPPPNVEGLDESVAQKIYEADAKLLRRNYDALLTVVHEESHLREVAEAKLQESLNDFDEHKASYELRIENLKLDLVGLRRKLRCFETRSSMPHVFEQYDKEVHSFQRELIQLRARNVSLELKLATLEDTSTTIISSGIPSTPEFIDLKKRYQTIVLEKQKLEAELQDYRKRERHFEVNRRIAEEATHRANKLQSELQEMQDLLTQTRLSKLKLNTERNVAQESANVLHQENEKLIEAKEIASKELAATRMHLVSMENDQKKADLLNDFIKKYGGQHIDKNQLDIDQNNKNKWRRDKTMKEEEEKLYHAIHRSLPTFLPTITKILRHIELQELSLLEYSEREVVFLNLVMDFVSEQPNVNLKAMIEQEMKNIRLY